MFRKTFLLLLVLVHANNKLCANSEKTKNLIESLDAFIENTQKSLQVPGVAVGILYNNEVVLAKGYGLRDVAKNLPVTTQTLFRAGSITKGFTGFCLGMLVDENHFNWLDPVSQHIPNFQLKNPETSTQITLKDYLTHTSGYLPHDAIWFNANYSREELIYKMRYIEPNYPLKSQFCYQNIGYSVAANVAEVILSQNWESIMQERVFDPIGMKNSTFCMNQMLQNENFSWGYCDHQDTQRKAPMMSIQTINPAGGINTNLDDLLLWGQVLLDKGSSFLQPDTWETMTSAQVPANILSKNIVFGQNELPFTESYGLGWLIIDYKGEKIVCHPGNMIGYSSLLLCVPDKNFYAVILTNKNHTPLPYLLGVTILEKMLDLPSKDWIDTYAHYQNLLQQNMPHVEPPANTPCSHPIGDYLGSYAHPGYGAVEVYEENETVYVYYNGLSIPLKHNRYNLFSTDPAYSILVLQGLRFLFQENINGDIDTLRIPFEQEGAHILFSKQISYDSRYLDQFVGTYKYQRFPFAVEKKDRSLLLKTPGFSSNFELIPYKKCLFLVKGWENYFVEFILDDNQEISGIKLTQPGGFSYTAEKS